MNRRREPRRDQELRDTIRGNLTRLLKAKGMSPYALAVAANLNQQAVYQFVAGDRAPTAISLGKMAAALRCSPAAFFRPVAPRKKLANSA